VSENFAKIQSQAGKEANDMLGETTAGIKIVKNGKNVFIK